MPGRDFSLIFCGKFQQPHKGDAGDYKVSVKNKWGTDFTTFLLG